jgi:hypothetical protein
MSFRKSRPKDHRPVQEQVSDLAYRLWETQGRPPGSSEAGWFLAESLVREYRQASPFDEFIEKTNNALNRISVKRGVRNDAEYARVVEERRYLSDILDRVEMLAFTYSRLMELASLYREAETRLGATSRIITNEPLTRQQADELAWQSDTRALEAAVLSHSSITN